MFKKSPRSKVKTSLVVALIFLLAAGGIVGAVFAQTFEDFEGIIDKDFFFGGKADVKKDNIEQTNETNREEITIQEQEARTAAATTITVTVQFSIAEFPIGSPNGSDKLQVEVVGTSPVLVSVLDGASVTRSVNLPAGTTHTLKITCVAALSVNCDSDVTILSGAVFNPPTPPSTTGAQMPMPGTPLTHTFTVNAS